jgi:hypothetical protein
MGGGTVENASSPLPPPPPPPTSSEIVKSASSPLPPPPPPTNSEIVKSVSPPMSRVEVKKRISSFLEKPDVVRIRKSLGTICPNSGQCVLFGLETQKMRRYFNDYDFSLVDKNGVKTIGGKSANGFVLEIPFVKDNYKAYAVLKNTIDKDNDNLFYEALVGLYVNKKNYIFPCFIETYGLYQWPETDPKFYERAIKFSEGNQEKKELVALDKLVKKKLSYKSFFHDPTFINSTCDNARFGCVLIQHIHSSGTIKTYMNTLKRLDTMKLFYDVHLPQYLYQVYAPLGMLSDEFTHYDLHDENVILYTMRSKPEPSNRNRDEAIAMIKADGVLNNGEYITMKYHYPDGEVVSFNTFDIAKILDYGRSYFKESEKINSSTYYQKLTESIKSSQEPSKRRGRGLGKCANESYNILEDEEPEGSFHYICTNKRNKSHDLRLVAMIRHVINQYKGTEPEKGLRDILEAIFYEDTYQINQGSSDRREGTQEVIVPSYTGLETLKPHESIRNVEDMHLALKDLIKTEDYQTMNQQLFKPYKKIGEMKIWLDGSQSLQYTVEG